MEFKVVVSCTVTTIAGGGSSVEGGFVDASVGLELKGDTARESRARNEAQESGE